MIPKTQTPEDIVTDIFIDQLADGRIPWNTTLGTPHFNFVIQHMYGGINIVYLNSLRTETSMWAGKVQLEKAGYSLQKNANPTQIIYSNNNGNSIKRGFTTVYNSAELDICSPQDISIKLLSTQDINNAFTDSPKIIPRFHTCSKSDEYDKFVDTIFIDSSTAHFHRSAYYLSLFNLLIQSTGVYGRLNRVCVELEEDLICDIGAQFLMQRCGIKAQKQYTPNEKLAIMYAMKKDKGLIFRAATAAQSAMDYILEEK